MNADLASDTPTTMHPMPHPKGGCHCSNRINKNHSSFIKKRKTGGDGFRASLPTSSTPPGCAMLFQSLPFTHPLFDVRHSPLFLFFFLFFFVSFFSFSPMAIFSVQTTSIQKEYRQDALEVEEEENPPSST